MANDPILGMLVASKPSSNQLFPGWGLTKVKYHLLLILYSQITFLTLARVGGAEGYCNH